MDPGGGGGLRLGHCNWCGRLNNMGGITGDSGIATCPDSANGRASASGVGGPGFESRPRHTKGVKQLSGHW